MVRDCFPNFTFGHAKMEHFAFCFPWTLTLIIELDLSRIRGYFIQSCHQNADINTQATSCSTWAISWLVVVPVKYQRMQGPSRFPISFTRLEVSSPVELYLSTACFGILVTKGFFHTTALYCTCQSSYMVEAIIYLCKEWVSSYSMPMPPWLSITPGVWKLSLSALSISIYKGMDTPVGIPTLKVWIP